MRIVSLISIVALLFVAWTSPTHTTAEDPVAILKKAQSVFEKLEDFSAKFSFTLSNPSDPNAKITKDGTLKYSKSKYAVMLPDQEFYCNGEKIWAFFPSDEEVTVYSNDPEEGFDIESMLQLYKANAKARHDGRVTMNGKTCHNIYLANSDSDVEFNQARLWVDVKTHLPVKVETVNRNQTRTVYSFTNVKTDQGIPPTAFEFDTSKHPDVTVYDETE
ncbi:MAG: outer membrane lipoprotein carrier protein LolA [Bacteroidia bacterium]